MRAKLAAPAPLGAPATSIAIYRWSQPRKSRAETGHRPQRQPSLVRMQGPGAPHCNPLRGFVLSTASFARRNYHIPEYMPFAAAARPRYWPRVPAA